MIADTLSRLESYTVLHPLFARVAAYLRQNDLGVLPDGRYEIDGNDLFLTLTRSPLRPERDAPLEAHRRYIDIQIVLEGEERFGWKSTDGCIRPAGEYSAERDIVFYEDLPDGFLSLSAGQMAVFFPSDAHAPLIGRGEVRKCIVKVRCENR